MIGTFVKTPHAAVVEVLGHSPLDCVCLDAEHAPFDRNALDSAILAARAHQLPALVRPQRSDPAAILAALDLGATGIIAPHIDSVDAAVALARAARFGPGGRGYSGATRAAGFGTRTLEQIITEANASVAVIAQVEDAEALDCIDEIALVEGIDALFIGRMDLTVSMGASSAMEPRVVDAVRHICAAAGRRKLTVGMFTATAEEAKDWAREGASFFLLASDQQWILQGSRDLVAAFRAPN